MVKAPVPPLALDGIVDILEKNASICSESGRKCWAGFLRGQGNLNGGCRSEQSGQAQ